MTHLKGIIPLNPQTLNPDYFWVPPPPPPLPVQHGAQYIYDGHDSVTAHTPLTQAFDLDDKEVPLSHHFPEP